MARISTYVSDTDITDSDKVIGSDAGASNATKNFTVGDLKSHINTGYATEAYADQAEADANTYTDNAVAPLIKQKVVGITPALALNAGVRRNIIYNSVTGDPSTGSLNYNSSEADLTVDTGQGEVENTSGGDLVLRIATTTFTTVSGGGGGSRTVSYFLQKYTTSWADVKEVQRVKASDGEYADSFWSYFKLQDGEKFRVQMLTTHDTVTIGAGSAFEFEVQK